MLQRKIKIDDFVKRKISAIECLIHNDIGNRGIDKLFSKNELLDFAVNLMEMDNILIVTGFYIFSAEAPETDGPPGALALANALRSLGKNICFYTDSYNYRILNALTSVKEFNVIKYSNYNKLDDIIKECGFDGGKKTGLISIESPARNNKGRYHNMSGIDITDYIEPLDSIFIEAAANRKDIMLFGIGDGGNEIGMGNLKEKIKSYVPNGGRICSSVNVDFLMTSAISNWGGIAAAFVLKLLNPDIDVELMTEQIHLETVEKMVSLGAVDGVTKKNELSVDGISMNQHNYLIKKMQEIVNNE